MGLALRLLFSTSSVVAGSKSFIGYWIHLKGCRNPSQFWFCHNCVYNIIDEDATLIGAAKKGPGNSGCSEILPKVS